MPKFLGAFAVMKASLSYSMTPIITYALSHTKHAHTHAHTHIRTTCAKMKYKPRMALLIIGIKMGVREMLDLRIQP